MTWFDIGRVLSEKLEEGGARGDNKDGTGIIGACASTYVRITEGVQLMKVLWEARSMCTVRASKWASVTVVSSGNPFVELNSCAADQSLSWW